MNETIGQNIDNVIDNVRNIPKSIENWVSGIKIQSPIRWPFGRQLSYNDKKLLASQDMPGLKLLLAKVGKGNEWYDCNQYLQKYMIGPKGGIRYQGKLMGAHYPYVTAMGNVLSDLIDELSASVSRELGRWNEDEEQDTRTSLKRSYYLNRNAQGNPNVYILAIEGIHDRLEKFFTFVKDKNLENIVHTEYRTSMLMLKKAFKQSGLNLAYDQHTGKINYFEDEPEDEEDNDSDVATNAQVDVLRKAKELMDRPVSGGFSGLHAHNISRRPPPIPKR